MTEHRGVRSKESPASLAMTEHRGVPSVGGDVRAPRSPRCRRRGPSIDVADDVRAVKCAHLVLEHEESEGRGVTDVAGDEQSGQLVGDEVNIE